MSGDSRGGCLLRGSRKRVGDFDVLGQRPLPDQLRLVALRVPRGVAVGRKNHYGSRSERGTRTAALFYSLIESAKLCGVEPHAYLREATLRAARNPGTVTLACDLKSPEA